MANKRQRKKIAKRRLRNDKAYKPQSTFRSTMSIQSTLFDPNTPKADKLIMLAESNLNRLSLVITKPGVVNLTNLTEDDVKYMASNQFLNKIEQLQKFSRYDKSSYRAEKQGKVENIIRNEINKYYQERSITSTRGLDKSLKRLVKQLDNVRKQYPEEKGNPFVIVYYKDNDLR